MTAENQIHGPAAVLLDILAPLRLALLNANEFQSFLISMGRRDALPEAQFAIITEKVLPIGSALTEAADTLQSIDPDTGLDAGTTLELLALAEGVFSTLAQLSEDTNDLTGLIEPYDDPAFWARLGVDIIDYLVVSYLRRKALVLYELLRALGVITRASGASSESVSWQAVPRLFTDPDGLFTDKYGSGIDFDTLSLMHSLARLFTSLGIRPQRAALRTSIREDIYMGEAPPNGAHELTFPLLNHAQLDPYLRSEAGFLLAPIPAETDKPDGSAGYQVGLMPYAEGEFTQSIPLNEKGTLTLTLAADVDLAGGLLITLDESGFQARRPTGESVALDGELGLTIRKSPNEGEDTIRIAGAPGVFELLCDAVFAGVGGSDEDFYFCLGAEGIRLLIDVAEDGLLGRLITAPIEVSAGDLLAGYRSGRGFYFEQGGALELTLPLSLKLGPIELSELGFGLELDTNITTYVWIDASAELGPLFLGVEGLGLDVVIVPAANPGEGRFGDFDLEFGLRFPTGYAASLDAAPISGGGYLAKEDKQYRGALALEFQNFGLSAFGILDTELPGGREGYSFLATLFGEFSLPLGYGFFLTGLGGLIGLNRTSEVDALREVLAEGRLDGILFPSNPIQDASRILDDLDTVFPSREGQFLVGPMARIGWGAPTLIYAKLGLVFEFGDEYRLLILGSAGSALPTEDAAIVILNVDFLGSIDFQTGAIGFDAAITNSRILTWPVSGEMALRSGWGSNAGLVTAVGGLHPQYPLPANFPQLERLTISFGTNNPSLTLTAYQALTLNSVQIGARASLYVKGPKIPLLGQVEVEGWAGYDALIIFNPFQFDAALTLGLKLLVNGDTLCGIGGDLRLKGPNSFYIKGRVWVTVLGFDVEVGVEKRWGDRKSEEIPEIDGLDALIKALRDASPEPVPGKTRSAGVSFLAAGADEDILIDPNGGLKFAQRALPLGVEIEKIGTSDLKHGPARYDIVAGLGDDSMDSDNDETRCEFVHASYWETSDSEKLRSPALDNLKCGVEIAGADDMLHPAEFENFDYAYETRVLDGQPDQPSRSAIPRALPDNLGRQWLNWTATFNPTNTDFIKQPLLANRVELGELGYSLAADQISNAGIRVLDNITSHYPQAIHDGAMAERRVVADYFTHSATPGVRRR